MERNVLRVVRLIMPVSFFVLAIVLWDAWISIDVPLNESILMYEYGALDYVIYIQQALASRVSFLDPASVLINIAILSVWPLDIIAQPSLYELVAYARAALKFLLFLAFHTGMVLVGLRWSPIVPRMFQRIYQIK